jgi:carbon-monoxide dehydrogenase medium subunit
MPQSYPQSDALVGLRSRKHIMPFDLVMPASPEAACAAKTAGARNVYMAGGLDLIDRMKTGQAFDRVIRLDGIASLRGIRRADGMLIIGALTTHAEIARSDLLADAVPGLPALWRVIANPRVRHVGTIGGNLMSGLPHYDAALALLALDAQAIVRTAAGARSIGIEVLAGHRDALLEAVTIDPAPSWHLVADRSLHPVLSVYLGARSAEGEVRSARIVVGCAFAQPVAVRLPVSGLRMAALASRAKELARVVAGSMAGPMLDDGLATAVYRRRMCEVLVCRLLIRLGATAC